MKNISTMKQKITTCVVYILTASLIIYFGFIVFGDRGFFHQRHMQADLEQLKSQNSSIEEENNALYHAVSRLKNDPEYVEHVIRTQLQMNAQDEIIFKFENRRGE